MVRLLNWFNLAHILLVKENWFTYVFTYVSYELIRLCKNARRILNYFLNDKNNFFFNTIVYLSARWHYIFTHCQPGFCTINGVGDRFVEMHMWLLKG